MNNTAAHTKLKAKALKELRKIPNSEWYSNPSGVAKIGKRFITYGLGKGSPDIVGVCLGAMWAVEVKTGAGVLSKEQIAWARKFTRAGGFFVVRKNDTWEYMVDDEHFARVESPFDSSIFEQASSKRLMHSKDGRQPGRRVFRKLQGA